MTKKIERQPIWESSSRPLYPKCVWVEGAGYRHFILDHDITKRKTIQTNFINGNSSSSSNSYSSGSGGSGVKKSISCDIIDTDKECLQLVGSSDVRTQRRSSNLSDDIFTGRQSCRRYSQSTAKSNLNTIKRQLNRRFPTKSSIDKHQASSSELSATTNDHNGPIECCTESIKDMEHLNLSKNLLTERVLQWLDLAGRNTIIRPDGETIRKPLARRICTTESIKKPTLPPSYVPPLKRAESLHHLSLTFNEDETYIATQQQQQQNENRTGDKSIINFGEFFPTTYRSSRAFLRNNSPKPTSASSTTTTKVEQQNPINEQQSNNSTKPVGKLKKNDKNIENQYRALIQRQILEKSCNTQLAKRQLHIFMPNLPKKKLQPLNVNNVVESDTLLGGEQEGAALDCDSSYLSTIFSSNLSK